MTDLIKSWFTVQNVFDKVDIDTPTDIGDRFTSDWMEFIEASILLDSAEREESSTEADTKETEKYKQLVKKYKPTDSPDVVQDMNSSRQREKLAKLVENSVQDLRMFSQRNFDHISTAGPDVARPEFIFGSPYDQFIAGKPAEGFRLFSIADQRKKIQAWLADLVNLLSLIGKFDPRHLPAISLNFLMAKICSAESHAQFICKNLANVLMSDDYWKVAKHLKDDVPINLVVDLLTLYCTDATLWYSSGKREWEQACLPKKVLQDAKTLKQVILILADNYSGLRRLLHYKRPTVLQSNLNRLKSTKSFISQEAVKVVRSLFDDNILPTPGQAMQDVNSEAILDVGLTELAVFVLSKDYDDFTALISNLTSSRVTPTDINIDLLCRCIKLFTLASEHDSLASKLIAKLMTADPFIDIVNYMLIWAAHLVRFDTVWKLRYQSKVDNFLDKNTPALSGEAVNPVKLLKAVTTVWRDKEKNLAEEKARAIKEAEAMEKKAKLKAEQELKEMKERLELDRKSELQQKGFQLAFNSGRYEKWFKDNTCRIFFKTTSPEEKKSVLVGLEELGISASKVRNIKNPAGIIRTITIGEDEIYSDSLIESALHKAARFKPEGPVFNTEVVSTAFDLVFDKTFFELEWLDKAIVRAMDDKVAIQDARYCTKVMRDRGIIGQIKGKKNGPKIFALTPEGYSLYQIQKDYPNLPILAVPWEKYIGEEVAERLGTLQYFDINTRPVKDIDKMIAGKTPRFLDKYYVTAI